MNSDLGLIRHTLLFVLLFNTVHPEDGLRRRPKHVGVVSKQRIKFISVFVGFFIKLALMHGMKYKMPQEFNLWIVHPVTLWFFSSDIFADLCDDRSAYTPVAVTIG